MIQSVQPAIEAYLAIFNNLPQPFIAFVFISLGVLVASALFRLFLGR